MLGFMLFEGDEEGDTLVVGALLGAWLTEGPADGSTLLVGEVVGEALGAEGSMMGSCTNLKLLHSLSRKCFMFCELYTLPSTLIWKKFFSVGSIILVTDLGS